MEATLKVILVSHTPDPEKTVGAAAKLCYSAAGIDELVMRAREEEQGTFLNKLTSMGHLSPVEHASFTFAIEGISRACSHQLVRHRVASYSQQSQRYVREDDFDYIIPPAIKADAELKELFERTMNEIRESYTRLVKALTRKGFGPESAKEDARFVLPNATETKILVSMNARELLHFFRQRLCNRAQWEIRELALSMLKLVRPVAPAIFRHAGPPCVTGKCPEGPHTCGKHDEIRAFFATLNT
ncbi:MAG: Thymidylate synthase ThyX [Syntrophorhabdaceae bacterium PtaU1.Bin034]|nr:MAG: Thymidylate synthase ThyX [Syntrophorhabdaceae bacterium PtaU1.Bin034]